MPPPRPPTVLRPKACRWWQAELLCAALALGALQAYFRAVQQAPTLPPASPTETPTGTIKPPDGDHKLSAPPAGRSMLGRGQEVAGGSGAWYLGSVVLLWAASLAKEIGITFVRLRCMVLGGVA